MGLSSYAQGSPDIMIIPLFIMTIFYSIVNGTDFFRSQVKELIFEDEIWCYGRLDEGMGQKRRKIFLKNYKATLKVFFESMDASREFRKLNLKGQ